MEDIQLLDFRPSEGNWWKAGITFSKAIAGSYVFYLASIVVYRIFLSPLRKIPGPFIAAITGVWIWVQDLKGSSVSSTYELHQKYGTIVRIGPREVSIQEPEIFTKVIYKQSSQFRKSPEYYSVFANESQNVFSTSDPVQHTYYRRQLSNHFSRKTILSFESTIWETTTTLSKQLALHVAERKPVDLVRLGRCLALDVVSRFAYGDSSNALRKPDFHEEFLDVIDGFAGVSHFFMMFPWLQQTVVVMTAMLPFSLFQAVPQLTKRVLDRLQKIQSKHHEFQPLLEAQIETARRHGIEVPLREVAANGIGSIVAGTDTTGVAIGAGLWSIFRDEKVRSRLHRDLTTIWANEERHPSLQDLEALPYLRACVQESLRFSTPISGRLPRDVPDSGLEVAGYHLPPGVRVSSSAYLVHFDENVFEHPSVFDPDRWLKGAPEQYLVPFSTGSRACIGSNLATAELYIVLATVVRWFQGVDFLDTKYEWFAMFTTFFPLGLKVVLEKILT